MTQEKENIKRIAEFSALFRTLNDRGQETAITVLRSLSFAQTVMCPQGSEQSCSPTKQL